MAENKTKATKLSVASFIAGVKDKAQQADAKSLVKMLESLTGEKATMWGPSIIGFGSYHYKYDTGREGDMPLVGFSPRKGNTAIYLQCGFTGAEALRAKLDQEPKGCMYIKKLADVDQKVLQQLFVKSIDYTKKHNPSK